jgi:hypothetical protein
MWGCSRSCLSRSRRRNLVSSGKTPDPHIATCALTSPRNLKHAGIKHEYACLPMFCCTFEEMCDYPSTVPFRMSTFSCMHYKRDEKHTYVDAYIPKEVCVYNTSFTRMDVPRKKYIHASIRTHTRLNYVPFLSA